MKASASVLSHWRSGRKKQAIAMLSGMPPMIAAMATSHAMAALGYPAYVQFQRAIHAEIHTPKPKEKDA